MLAATRSSSGTGGGQPLGFMNSAALITQAIEATQTIANTELPRAEHGEDAVPRARRRSGAT
jgi:hypothetical protein